MYSIKENIENKYIINKSVFICKLIRINTEQEAKELISKIRSDYHDATHVCYGYICDNIKRFSDDGEPNGTAGMPILNVLENNDLNYILCVVIRYFGGIKLGAGGLVRAYTKSTTECLNKAKVSEIVPGLELSITFNYSNIKRIDSLLKNISIKDKTFNNTITYIIEISDNKYNELINDLNKIVVKSNILRKIIIPL